MNASAGMAPGRPPLQGTMGAAAAILSSPEDDANLPSPSDWSC
jgi:hypothetical protein